MAKMPSFDPLEPQPIPIKTKTKRKIERDAICLCIDQIVIFITLFRGSYMPKMVKITLTPLLKGSELT